MNTTLRTRLISLLILSSLFLISVFTMIQLNNQVQKTREIETYQSRQEALAIRDKLEAIFSAYDEKTSKNSNMEEVKDAFKSTLEGGVVNTISLLDKDGRPVILEGDLKLLFEDDKDLLNEIANLKKGSGWTKSVVDKEHKIINLYMAFNNSSGYILKLTFLLANIQRSLNAVYGPVIFTVLIVIMGNIILGILLSYALLSPIKVLNKATKDVASGNLDLKIHIDTKDELEELSDTFNQMTIELKKMKIRAENANPLTKLPGNIVIREEVEKRLAGGEKFVLIYSDLDHFKAFNDKYGVQKGDEVIMLTADIIKEAIAKEGLSGDFAGHEGGDDFLLLTVPDRAEKIARYISKEFNSRVRPFYSEEDINKGYIEAKGREIDKILRFPIMTISLAGVSNLNREITSYAQITNIAAEVKKAVKNMSGFKFLIDRRTDAPRA